MAQMKEQIKTPEKELSDKKIDKLSDAEFKILVVSMLTEMIEYERKIKEDVKAIQSETYREPTVKERKLRLKSTIRNRRKK